MKNDYSVNTPCWYYRDVQQGMQEILANAPKIGSLNDAMVEYLFRRSNGLPKGLTAADAVAKIRESVDGFMVAHEEGRSSEDVRDRLRSVVGEMDGRQAIVYLTLLETTFRACDAKALGCDGIPSADELGEKILSAAQEATPAEIDSRVDALAEAITGDSLKAYVFVTGNDELKDLVSRYQEVAQRTELQERIYDALCSDVKKGEVFAAVACACYGMILEGKISGVSAENLDVGVMTNLVVAGLEKASILTRMSRGEIDMELAKEMLAALSRVVKWILVKALQLAVVGGAFLSAGSLAVCLELIAPTAGLVMLIGVIVGVTAAISMQETFEEIADVTVDLFEAATGMVIGVLSWAWDKTTNAIKHAISPVRVSAAAIQ